MKKLSLVVVLLLMMVPMLSCKKKVTEVVAPAANQVGTLQGKVMDALTGVPIGGDIQLTLIQGSGERGPDKLHTDAADPLIGEFAFSSIPVDITAINEITFKVVVVKTGYQSFEADINVAGTASGKGTLNSIINIVRNIYLFPLATAPGDVTVMVHDAHLTVVPNAKVILQQDVANTVATAITGTVGTLQQGATAPDRLFPTGGLYPSLTATTGADGIATFSGAQLVLGGKYQVVVEAINFNGDELGTIGPATFPNHTTPFIVGTTTANQHFVMNGIAVFFATAASNLTPGTITPSGILSVTFNEPIALTTTGFVASGLATNGTPTSSVIQAVLSADFKTMTLTPTSIITGTTVVPGSGVTYTPVTSPTDPTPLATATPFVLKDTQTPVGTTFGAGLPSDLRVQAAGPAVSNFVQQIPF